MPTQDIIMAAAGDQGIPPGEVIYTGLNFTYYYFNYVDLGINTVCILAVSPGQGQYATTNVNSVRGQRGGGLYYVNNLDLSQYVGATRLQIGFASSSGSSNLSVLATNALGDTIYGGFYVSSIGASDAITGASLPAYTGGTGGTGQTTSYRGGGGGAAGYAGSGGSGGGYTGGSSGTDGSGGGGGGGGRSTAQNSGKGSGGGGVGLYGQGANGAGASSGNGGGGGSGGSNGYASGSGTRPAWGGDYGGGPGGCYNSSPAPSAGAGAVRIIWGAGRSFPNNAT